MIGWAAQRDGLRGWWWWWWWLGGSERQRRDVRSRSRRLPGLAGAGIAAARAAQASPGSPRRRPRPTHPRAAACSPSRLWGSPPGSSLAWGCGPGSGEGMQGQGQRYCFSAPASAVAGGPAGSPARASQPPSRRLPTRTSQPASGHASRRRSRGRQRAGKPAGSHARRGGADLAHGSDARRAQLPRPFKVGHVEAAPLPPPRAVVPALGGRRLRAPREAEGGRAAA